MPWSPTTANNGKLIGKAGFPPAYVKGSEVPAGAESRRRRADYALLPTFPQVARLR